MDLVIVKLGSEQEDNSRKFFFPGKMGRYSSLKQERERGVLLSKEGGKYRDPM